MKLLQNVWYSGTIFDFDERDRIVASGATPEIAAHIVRCVNAHDDLVAALEAALRWGSRDGMRPHPTDPEFVTMARAALAKAKGN